MNKKIIEGLPEFICVDKYLYLLKYNNFIIKIKEIYQIEANHTNVTKHLYTLKDELIQYYVKIMNIDSGLYDEQYFDIYDTTEETLESIKKYIEIFMNN